jgi:putative restriction endonuclease
MITRCAFCRLKVMRNITQNIVDGSHIKPFSKFYDNQINNGISLCKNHHWAFDQGWFAIDDNYRIIVANDLEEESPNAKPMKDFHSQTILLPTAEQYLPRLESLQWHRLNVFRA